MPPEITLVVSAVALIFTVALFHAAIQSPQTHLVWLSRALSALHVVKEHAIRFVTASVLLMGISITPSGFLVNTAGDKISLVVIIKLNFKEIYFLDGHTAARDGKPQAQKSPQGTAGKGSVYRFL